MQHLSPTSGTALVLWGGGGRALLPISSPISRRVLVLSAGGASSLYPPAAVGVLKPSSHLAVPGAGGSFGDSRTLSR